MNTTVRTTRYTARRGVTFLEVVLGVVLLGLVASTLGATVGAVGKSFQRQRDRLAAAEVASRIMLIRLDDAGEMPDHGKPIGYGEREFRWAISESPIGVSLSTPARDAVERRDRDTVPRFSINDRLVSMTVTVWLAETSSGSHMYSDRVSHARISRVVDPLGFQTHDSLVRRFSTRPGREEYFRELVDRLGK